MMLELSPESLIVPYFVSGLAFFALGLAVALQMGRAHGYPFHRPLALLAAVGFVRAVKKWLDLADLEQVSRTHAAATGGGWLKLALLVAAFLLLAGYGLAVWRQVAPKRHWRWWVLPGLADAAWARAARFSASSARASSRCTYRLTPHDRSTIKTMGTPSRNTNSPITPSTDSIADLLVSLFPH